ncbi:unnamed protein product [Chrysodeixis includens]|uniref:Cytochrome b5 n=1 Tax=Chrysodeixis includens TaxID=689277 RepID=A0A9N8KVC7_CHRIL|nr:unnamed protein product [Chrysodeixis includens]
MNSGNEMYLSTCQGYCHSTNRLTVTQLKNSRKQAINLPVFWSVNNPSKHYATQNYNMPETQNHYITANEVKRHHTRRSVWMVIHNEVYDVTSFVNEHPGGEDPLLDAAGLDATIAFYDVGHSEVL